MEHICCIVFSIRIYIWLHIIYYNIMEIVGMDFMKFAAIDLIKQQIGEEKIEMIKNLLLDGSIVKKISEDLIGTGNVVLILPKENDIIIYRLKKSVTADLEINDDELIDCHSLSSLINKFVNEVIA